MPSVEQPEQRHRRKQLRENRRERRAADPHRGKRSHTKNEERVENYIDDHARHHHAAGDTGVAGRDQQVVAHHRKRSGRTAEVPDIHIFLHFSERFALCAETLERAVDRHHAEHRQHHGKEEHQHQPGGRQPRRPAVSPTAQRLRRRGHHSDAEPAEDAADQHDDRKGEPHRRQRNLRMKLTDEEGVRNVVAGHRQRARHHCKRGFHHCPADGTTRVDRLIFLHAHCRIPF